MATATSRLFGNVIVCDDVRHELNNKKTLVGVFSGDIVVYNKPARFAFAVYVEYYPKLTVPHSLRLFVGVGSETLEAEVNLTEWEGSVILALPRVGLNIAEDGKFTVAASINGGKRAVILEKGITLRPPPAESIASSPPS